MFPGQSLPQGNGGQSLIFPAETSTDRQLFEQKLNECINRTKRGWPGYIPEAASSIDGLLVKGTKKGIYLNKDVFPENYEEILTTHYAGHGITIKFNLKRGKKEFRTAEYYIFGSIRW